jgi:hypothetical protein
MAIHVGDKVYLRAHAYCHYLGEVSEILGVRRVSLKNASIVYSCARGWEDFFRDGCGNDTKSFYVGNVLDTGYYSCEEWQHPLPKPKTK